MKKKLTQKQMIKKFAKIYEDTGAEGCYKEANKLKLKYLVCLQCDANTPRYKDDSICLCCGQAPFLGLHKCEE